jgi:glycosyltransferase involved in cell wall biosynthesis
MHKPLVSVLMPVFNRREYVSITIESVLTQTFSDFEFVIIDDGSEDGSAEIVKDYASRDRRIKCVFQKNMGYSSALNNGLPLCKGRFIARIDSDDICLPDRLKEQVKFLSVRDDYVLVGGEAEMIDDEGYTFGHVKVVRGHKEIVNELLGITYSNKSAIIHPSVLIRAEAVFSVSGYRTFYEPAEDRDLWLRLSQFGYLENLDFSLIKYRVHSTNVSTQRRQLQISKSKLAIQDARVRMGVGSSVPLLHWSEQDNRSENESLKRMQMSAASFQLKAFCKYASKCCPEYFFDFRFWKCFYILFRRFFLNACDIMSVRRYRKR